MEMTILERDDDITHVALAGRLDTTGAEEINQRFSEATAAKKRPTIVDLSEIDFMASRGIGLLFAQSKKLKKAGRKLVILKPQELVEGVLTSSKMDKVMPIAHDLDQAIQIAKGEEGLARPQVKTAAEETGAEQEAMAPVVTEGAVSSTIKNELSELEGLSATVRQFLIDHSVPERAAYAVNLAIDELVVNVMRYAYVDADTHMIDIDLAVEGNQVILRIVDDGREFDPRRGPALDLHAEDREVGGLGILLVLDMVDVLKYQRVDDKNCVEVRVHLKSETEGGESSEAKSAPPSLRNISRLRASIMGISKCLA